MTNHPHRSRRKDAPTPAQIRTARTEAGLSRESAARLIYKSLRTWEKYEIGERPMDLAYWHLFRLQIGLGPPQ